MCYTAGVKRSALLCACVVWACAGTAAAAPSPWADSRDDDLRVALVTFGPGDAVHQYFGHNALMIGDARRGTELLYNFGMFGFGPDMLPKYLQGQLLFWSAATPVGPTYRHYAADNRSIRVRELDLSSARRRALADALDHAVQPESRYYLYDHYQNNCSTKVRDLIDLAIGGQLARRWKVRGEHTHRGDTRRYTEHDPVIHLLLMLWMNDSMERPITRYDEAFLPAELERLVDGTVYRDDEGRQVKLAKLAYTVFEARRPPVPAAPNRTWPVYLGLGLLLGAVSLALGRWYERTSSTVARVAFGLEQAALGVVLGVPALVATLFLLTGHVVTYRNENLFIANALTFASLPLGVATAFGSRWAMRALGKIWLALGAGTVALVLFKALPMFDQDVSIPLALYGPLNLGCALTHVRLRRAAHRAQPVAGE
jgi:hypothetical protein